MATNTMEDTRRRYLRVREKRRRQSKIWNRAGVKREQIHIHAGRTSGAKESTQHEGGFSGWIKSLFW